MPAPTAGLILYRRRDRTVEFLIVHHGGPFWANRHAGAWSIPKGEINDNEDPLDAAKREFAEETGFPIPPGPFIPLTPVTLRSRKVIHAWGVEGDHDPAAISSNTFEMEWPPKSGKRQSFPEVDQARFCTLPEARELLNPAVVPLLEELSALLRT